MIQGKLCIHCLQENLTSVACWSPWPLFLGLNNIDFGSNATYQGKRILWVASVKEPHPVQQLILGSSINCIYDNPHHSSSYLNTPNRWLKRRPTMNQCSFIFQVFHGGTKFCHSSRDVLLVSVFQFTKIQINGRGETSSRNLHLVLSNIINVDSRDN